MKSNRERFVLTKFKAYEDDITILDTCFADLSRECAINYDINSRIAPYMTLILGENGAGKSSLFNLLSLAFICLEEIKTGKRVRITYPYSYFEVEYLLNGHRYQIVRKYGQALELRIDGNNIESDFVWKKLALPKKLLAVSFVVNDKFEWSPSDSDLFYTYLGVRERPNNTFITSTMKKTIENVYTCAARNLVSSPDSDTNYLTPIYRILKVLGFSEELIIKDRKTEFEVCFGPDLNEVSTRISSEELKEKVLFVKKDDNEIPFRDLSSGEKHLLFAFSGIASEIEDNSLILFDEPELSLHPEWQTRLIGFLEEAFEDYPSCQFILASHSHYLVSSLYPGSSSLVVMGGRAENERHPSRLVKYDTYAWSAESVIYEVFGIRSSRNYYFACELNRLNDLVNMDEPSESDRSEIADLLGKLSSYIFHKYDPLKQYLESLKERLDA